MSQTSLKFEPNKTTLYQPIVVGFKQYHNQELEKELGYHLSTRYILYLTNNTILNR